MAWTVSLKIRTVPDAAKYRLLRDGAVVAEVPHVDGPAVAVTDTLPDDGPVSYAAVAVDAAGNVSGESAPLSVVLDHVAPKAPGGVELVAVAWS